MPTISLRLTEAEHEALKEWAHDSRRSLQKEAVYRIFSEHVVADAQPRDVPTRTVEPTEYPHFKPDFKK